MSEPAPTNPLGHSAAAKNVREARREQVAILLLSRVPYRRIAEQVGCSYTAVRADVDVIRARWRERYADAYEAHVSEQVGTLDALMRTWMPKALGTNADPKALDAVMRLLERRARLLGLDKPAKVEHSGQIEVTDELVARGELAIDEVARKREQRGAG